jgi:hypothetical protein
MTKHKYHCILSNYPKGKTILTDPKGRIIDYYLECEDWSTMTEAEFEEYKKPGKATNGWNFVRVVDKEKV